MSWPDAFFWVGLAFSLSIWMTFGDLGGEIRGAVQDYIDWEREKKFEDDTEND